MTTEWGVEMRVVRLVDGNIAEELCARFRRFPTESTAMLAYRGAGQVLDVTAGAAVIQMPDNKQRAAGDL